MKKREWIYVQPPADYGIDCDICTGINIAWSEFEGMIWCYDCEKDTEGTGGLFDGPIMVETCKMMGISFDRIILETGEVETFGHKGDKCVWRKVGE